MTPELTKFIKENKNLMNQNTKESWEEIYDKIHNEIPYEIRGEFTKIILDAGINDPAEIMGYIPEYYLCKSEIADYKIPNNVTSIHYQAFHACNILTNMVIPDSVTIIYNGAFSNCQNLTSLTIPGSVKRIWYRAFDGCINLTSLVIGDGVTNIGEGAFKNCDSLKEIQFKGTKKKAIQSGIANKSYISNDRWEKDSPLEKIICTDGVIEL